MSCSSSSRLLHDSKLIPACRGPESSAAAADAQRERHTLRPVQLLPVQPGRTQPWGAASIRAGERRAAGHGSVERLGLTGAPVVSGGAGSQHLLAQRVSGESKSLALGKGVNG